MLLSTISLAMLVASLDVAGIVVDARTGAPIANADVAVAGARGTTRTDRRGGFRLAGALAPPFVVIVILPDGRVARPVHVARLDAGAELRIVVETTVAETVSVQGAAPSVDVPPGSSLVLIPAADLSLRHPMTLTEALETVPGVGVVSEGQAAAPAIRGLARGRTLILVDGARVSAERGAGANAAFLDPDGLHSVDVARGPGSVAYGTDAFGGVIAARTRRVDVNAPMRVRLSGTAAAGLPQWGAALEWSAGYGRGGALFGVRRRTFGDYRSPEGTVPHSSWRDAGVRVRWDHGGWSMAWQRESARDIERPRSDSTVMLATSPVEETQRFTVGYERPALGGFRNVRIDALVGGVRQRVEQERLAAPGRPRRIDRSDSSARDVQIRLTGERSIRRVRLHTGADLHGRYGLASTDTAIVYNAAGTQPTTTVATAIDNAHRMALGVFGQADIPAGRLLRFTAGLRGDGVRSVNRGGFFGHRSIAHGAAAGVFAVTFTPTPGFALTAQAARGFRDATLTDRFSRGVVGRGFIEGNPTLAPETSLQFDLHAQFATGRLGVGAALYDYRLTNLIERYSPSADLFLFRNRGRARLTGGEIDARLDLGRGLAVSAMVQASRGRDAIDHTPLDDVAPRAAAVIARHTLANRLSSYVRVAAVAAHRDAGPGEVPTPGYTLVDAGAHWTLSSHLEVRGLVRNALDEAHYSSAGPRWVWAPGRSVSLTVTIK